MPPPDLITTSDIDGLVFGDEPLHLRPVAPEDLQARVDAALAGSRPVVVLYANGESEPDVEVSSADADRVSFQELPA